MEWRGGNRLNLHSGENAKEGDKFDGNRAWVINLEWTGSILGERNDSSDCLVESANVSHEVDGRCNESSRGVHDLGDRCETRSPFDGRELNPKRDDEARREKS
ncbi:hypothetical protein KPH14_006865 [Odynerus spinipes]|uniref:Uncharacterized protein n=1 Tax=Odynerus spinipes TaxID=1348599 RepID=A0AAD9RRE9_9HYME|nr:hypothetical protein KPH14_006865 [Odynerus spinipes]